jgi:iron(III) transport system permease protein
MPAPKRLRRSAIAWSLLGGIGFLLVPWYALADGVWGFGWLARLLIDRDLAPAIVQSTRLGRPWLGVPGLVLLAALIGAVLTADRAALGRRLTMLGAGGFVFTLGQGFAIGLSGWSWPFLERLFGALDDRQPGLGLGALVVAASFLFLFSTGLAARGAFRGDGFIASSVVLVTVLIGLFTFFPVARILASAVVADQGAFSATAFAERLFAAKIWRLDCLARAASAASPGTPWHSRC